MRSNLAVAYRSKNKIGICVDLRAVNKAIIPAKYPLPTLDEFTLVFHESTVFTKLNLGCSYLKMYLTKDSKYPTAFIIHGGVFQSTGIPYGVASAPSAFQKIISSILSYYCFLTVNLIDNVVVHGNSSES